MDWGTQAAVRCTPSPYQWSRVGEQALTCLNWVSIKAVHIDRLSKVHLGGYNQINQMCTLIDFHRCTLPLDRHNQSRCTLIDRRTGEMHPPCTPALSIASSPSLPLEWSWEGKRPRTAAASVRCGLPSHQHHPALPRNLRLKTSPVPGPELCLKQLALELFDWNLVENRWLFLPRATWSFARDWWEQNISLALCGFAISGTGSTAKRRGNNQLSREDNVGQQLRPGSKATATRLRPILVSQLILCVGRTRKRWAVTEKHWPTLIKILIGKKKKKDELPGQLRTYGGEPRGLSKHPGEHAQKVSNLKRHTGEKSLSLFKASRGTCSTAFLWSCHFHIPCAVTFTFTPKESLLKGKIYLCSS